MRTHKTDGVRIILPEAALELIFDECDRFDNDETGGRIVGTFSQEADNLMLQVTGLIEAGPGAERSRVSLFQDGPFQESVFRKIEHKHPETEHLGTWHTHHVNGLQTLSDGDLDTYHRTVNHESHNTSFFYALLVTTRNHNTKHLPRYNIKHYLFRRGDDRAHEVPASHVKIVQATLVWPTSANDVKHTSNDKADATLARPERVYDRDMLADFYPGLRSFVSHKLGLYWRGSLELIDGSNLEVVVLESLETRTPKYSVTVREPPTALTNIIKELEEADFLSARAALVSAERKCNRALYEQLGKS